MNDRDRTVRTLLIWVVPAAMATAMLVPIAVAWSSFPDPVAIHWAVSGRPNGSAPRFAGVVLPALGWLVTWAWLVGTARGGVAAGGLGPTGATAYFVGAVLAAVSTSVVVANAGASSWEDAALPGGLWSVAGTVALAVAAARVGWRLGRRAQPPAGTGGERLEPVPADAPVPGTTVFVERISNRVLVVGSAALAVGSLLAPWFPGTWVVVGAATIGAFASTIRVVASARDGVQVGFGPWGWPAKRVRLDRIERAGVIDVEPLAYGGWGYRIRPAALSPGGARSATAVIIRRGRALALDLTDGRRFVVTVDGAADAAALLNRLVESRSEPGTTGAAAAGS